MKNIHRFTAMVCMLAMFITSCKKEIDQPRTKEVLTQSSITIASACHPAIYASYQNGSGLWTTIAQKWYTNGKVKNIKLHFTGRPMGIGINHDEPILNVDWGNVTYEGNQVKLTDVGRNKLVFRVTLDDVGKPVASYLYTDAWLPDQTYVDTTYYYYTGDRLNNFIQIFATFDGFHFYSQGWEQYSFTYNSSGDLASVYARNEQVMTRLLYSSTPVVRIVNDYPVTTSFKLLEYLELLNMPMGNTLQMVDFTRLYPGYPPYTFYEKRFFNYTIGNGLVQSYIFPMGSDYQTFHISWDCGDTAN